VRQAVQLMASLGARNPDDLTPHMLRKKVAPPPWAPVPNCTNGFHPDSCSPSRPRAGRQTGPPRPRIPFARC
jgi:hypothetical protein